MCEKQQRTMFLANYYEELCRTLNNGHYSTDRSLRVDKAVKSETKTSKTFRSEFKTTTGKPYQKTIEIPVTRETVATVATVPTTPTITANTTVMSYKKGCKLFESSAKI